jgi:hypothetical protein
MAPAAKKSRQKIRRNINRAEARGETYTPPEWFIEEETSKEANMEPNINESNQKTDNNDDNDNNDNSTGNNTDNNTDRWYSEEELAAMSAKERRQKKRMMVSLNLQPPASNKTPASSDEKVPTAEELEAMSSKDRRKWKRKLEALEAEKTNVDVTEFREAKKQKAVDEEAEAKAAAEAEESKKPNPYIGEKRKESQARPTRRPSLRGNLP